MTSILKTENLLAVSGGSVRIAGHPIFADVHIAVAPGGNDSPYRCFGKR